MKKTLWILIVLAVVGLVTWLGYRYWLTLQEQQRKAQLSRVKIRAAESFWPGQFWKKVAERQGWFTEAGLDVEIIDTNQDYYGSLQAMVDRKMEVNDFPIFDFVLYNTQGANLIGVIDTDISLGIDALLANSNIATTTDLKGQRVGVVEGTFSQYFLSVALERVGLGLNDVVQVEIQAEEAPQALQQGRVAAVVTYEPYVTQAITEARAHRLFDSAQQPGLNVGIESFSREFVEQYPDVVQAYVAVWQRTTQFIKEQPDQALALVAEVYQAPIAEVKAMTEGDKILDLTDNQTAFGYAAGFDSLHGAFRRINQFLIDEQMTTEHLDSQEFIDNRFIKALEKR